MAKRLNDRLAVSILECEFATRLVNILQGAGIKTLRDAFERDKDLPNLMDFRLFAEVRAVIEGSLFVPGDWVVVKGGDDDAYLGQVGLVVKPGTFVRFGADGPTADFSAYDLRRASPEEVRHKLGR